jgi:hypothetical protein
MGLVLRRFAPQNERPPGYLLEQYPARRLEELACLIYYLSDGMMLVNALCIHHREHLVVTVWAVVRVVLPFCVGVHAAFYRRCECIE